MSRSEALLERAVSVIPGGVNSPVRAFKAVGGQPLFIQSASGSTITDADGREYIDLVGSWGPMILGHARPEVVAAARVALGRGSSFGAPTEAEVDFAEAIRERVPSMELVRLCSSGTEATMHAIRLMRGYTGRDRIIKLEGCYHGAHDAVLVSAGSGVATFATPGSPGVPEATASQTLVAPYNDLDAVKALFEAHPNEVAGIILEPVPGNMGCIPPGSGYLQGLRALCDENDAVLCFDEVMSGLRVARGCAQELYDVRPDLTCLGKIVGGGFPLAAFGGREAIMRKLAPDGPVYQAGTLSGNPVAVAAGLATLELLEPAVYERLEAIGQAIEDGISDAVQEHGCSMTRVGSMLTIFFREEAPTSFAEVKTCDFEAFGRFFQAALERGLYLPPSQYEAVFLSSVLTDAEVDQVVRSLREAIAVARG